MWFGKSESTETLFSDLHREVRFAAPSAHLSYSLRSRLERCDPKTRSKICSRAKDGSTPLFIACKKGNVEIVDYLLTFCGVDVEHRGLYEVPDDRSVHTVTPLWCASVAGKVKVVEVLVRHGADVNSVSDTGSTPVRSACFMTHLDIVKLLVANHADIQRPNYNGGTCLINSVQSGELCEFLLLNGANVNAQDIQNKTALHYAIQEHRFETTKLLLLYGANPFLESRYKDDALQTACLKGASEIFEYLVDNVRYSPERLASAFELMGSTFLDEHHDSQKALRYWRAACDLRNNYKLMKPVSSVMTSATTQVLLPFGQRREFATKEELESIALDLDALRVQSLLICERILGTNHKDMIYRLMYRGAAYADSLQYQHCIDLWKYALELRVDKDTVLYCDTCFTAQALVKLYLDLHEKNVQGLLTTRIRLEDVMSTIELLVRDLPSCAQLLTVTPVFRRQVDSYDKMMRIVTHLLYLVTRLTSSYDPSFSDDDVINLRRRIHRIVCNLDPRTTSGDSLLHLSVMKNNTLKSQSLFEEGQYAFFPSYDVTRLLLDCGARVDCVNVQKNSPLHTASHRSNFRQEIVEVLLKHGSHIDARNRSGQRPVDLLKQIPDCKINPLHFTSLKCLAARVIADYQLPYKLEVPAVLDDFIETH